MALLWLDGFEDNTLGAYTSSGVIISMTSRTGAYACHFTGTGTLTRVLGASPTTVYVGLAKRIGMQPLLVQLYEGATLHLELTIAGSSLTVKRGTTTIGTHTISTVAGVFYYFEFGAYIHSTAGWYQIRMDGATVGSGSSLNTRNGGSGYVDRVTLSQTPDTGYSIDDIYICDNSGSDCNTFLGPIRITHLRPNANGATSQLTGTDGDSINNYLHVDEVTPNGDTDYVYSNVSGYKDTYNLDDLPSAAYSVVACMLRTVAKHDGGAAAIKTVVRHSGSEVDSSSKTLTASWDNYYDLYGAVNPVSSSSWTVSSVNALEVGVKIA